jgi:transposase-like protein
MSRVIYPIEASMPPNNPMAGYTVLQFEADFPDETACLAAVMRLRYGGTDIYCPACMSRTRFHIVRGRRAYACQICGHHLFPCAQTIFARSRTPLLLWFRAIFLATALRRGVSATTLKRHLRVTYKTAWKMARVLRGLSDSADYRGALAGFGPRFGPGFMPDRDPG